MERFISIISGIFLFVLIGFTWGWLALTFNIFPYAVINSTVNDVVAFLEGGEGDKKLTIVEKLKSDIGGTPFRQLVNPIYTLSYNGCNGLSSKFKINKDSCEIFSPGKTNETDFSTSALVYGPYVELRAGSYEAVFDISIDAPLSEVVGFFDVVNTSNGEIEVFNGGSFSGTAGHKNDLKFNFTLPQDMRQIEFRIFLETPVPSVVRS